MHQISFAHRTRPAPAAPNDSRWAALGAVQAAMESLGLKARDITVLRGLLTFIPADRWAEPLMVFASNAALQARCDGIDERTLRRRLTRLCEAGLIIRKQSPNRKRYVVRDETGASVLSYGFDLGPLRDNLERLQAIAAETQAKQVRVKVLKAVLRDRIYRLSNTHFRPETDLVTFQRMLRHKGDIATLETAIIALDNILNTLENTGEFYCDAMILTDSDGQNDRDIQSSNKEYVEDSAQTQKQRIAASAKTDDLTLTECIEAAKSALEFCQEQPQSWAELSTLAHQLAPAIGVAAQQFNRTKAALGDRGATLAILGLVEAFARIREPSRYLNALVTKASAVGLDVARMFRSLTATTRFPAGNRGAMAY